MEEGEHRKFKVEASSDGTAQVGQAAYSDKSFIKVSRNSRGYNWEIKIVDDDIDEAFKKAVEVDKDARTKFEVHND